MRVRSGHRASHIITLHTNGSSWELYGQSENGGIILPVTILPSRPYHDALAHLSGQAVVNSRIWKWVQVLQGYDRHLVSHTRKEKPFRLRFPVKSARWSKIWYAASGEPIVIASTGLLLVADAPSNDAIQKKLDQIRGLGYADPLVTQAHGSRG